MFKIEFKTDNSAFVGCPEMECERILDQIKEVLQKNEGAGEIDCGILDINGNSVGRLVYDFND